MRPLDRICNAALWITAGLGLATVAATIAMLALDVRPVVVRSGSMAEAYPARSLTLVERIPSSRVRTGDTLLVQRPGGERVLHRVAAVERGSTGTLVRLKGDANDVADAEPVALEASAYRAGLSVPLVGAAVVALRGPLGGFGLGLVVLAPLFVLGGGRGGERRTATAG